MHVAVNRIYISQELTFPNFLDFLCIPSNAGPYENIKMQKLLMFVKTMALIVFKITSPESKTVEIQSQRTSINGCRDMFILRIFMDFLVQNLQKNNRNSIPLLCSNAKLQTI